MMREEKDDVRTTLAYQARNILSQRIGLQCGLQFESDRYAVVDVLAPISGISLVSIGLIHRDGGWQFLSQGLGPALNYELSKVNSELKVNSLMALCKATS